MTEIEIETQVKKWNGNASIFDVYDEIKYLSEETQAKLLKKVINEYTDQESKDQANCLADHLCISHLLEDEREE
jgi:hypothetical protein